jgi:hypothetical protein
MDRRKFGVFLPGLILLTSCGNAENKPDRAATFLNNEEVRDALTALAAAVDELESNASSFDDENWRDVVPEVQTGVTNVRDALSTLKTALGAE